MASAAKERTAEEEGRAAVTGWGAVGLALAYTGWPLATSGGTCGPRDGLLVDGSSLVALAPLLVILVVLHRVRPVLGAASRRRIALVAVLCEGLSLAAIGGLRLAGLCTPETRFTLCVVLAVATVVAVAHWLARARGVSVAVAATLVFSALALSAALQLLLGLLPDGVLVLVAAALTLGQLACPAGRRPLAGAGPVAESGDDYYAFMMAGAANRRFLVACALGLAAMALVAGFLCGFPSDHPRELGFGARLVAFALTEAVCVAIIAAVRRRGNRMMTVGIWVVMELLAAGALVLYNAFPVNAEPGAVASQLLNTVMVGALWHFIIALMSAGHREPLYYADVAWLIWLGSHDIGHLLLVALPTGGASHFTGALISLLLLVSTQLILVKLIDVGRFAASRRTGNAAEEGKAAPAPSGERSGAEDGARRLEGSPSGAEGGAVLARATALERLLGLDAGTEEGDANLKVMRERARRMGVLFMLSDREVEVLALYGLGFTQKRVAEELFISPTTAHTHITRIYAKTNLHSRQEILDFMRDHCE